MNKVIDGNHVLRLGRWSIVFHQRAILVAALLGVALFVSCALSVSLGNGRTTGWTAVSALWDASDVAAWKIVHIVRMPRFVAGAVAGAALGLSGCLIQTLARNRLATPDLVGVNDGATVAVLVTMLGSTSGALGAWWAGPIGAVAAAVLVVLIAGSVGTTGYRILVVGIGLSVTIDAVTNLVLARQSIDDARGLFTWTLGYLNGRDYEIAIPAALGVAVLLPLVAVSTRQLQLLRFTDDTAETLGVSARRTRLWALLVAVLLAGLAVGIGGPITFVAMAAPILATGMAGPKKIPIVNAALVGALLVTVADTAGRAVGDVEIPVGVLTGLLGGPFLLWVLLRRKV